MLKKLIGLTVAMIFGSLVLMNLSIEYSSSSVRAEESHWGSLYVGTGGKTICVCPGDTCLGCVTIEEIQ